MYGIPSNLWKISKYRQTSEDILVPTSAKYNSVQVPGNLYVDGHIINPLLSTLQEQLATLKEQLQKLQQDVDELKT
jgi:tRNA(Phe) wybutosine-synthesizing methylase Tyw3